MSEVIVRPATLGDVPGINEIYRHDAEPSPWSKLEECTIVINHRLLTGIKVFVAEYNGRIVGHADYVIGCEPQPFGKTVHLSVLQVHPSFRHRGVGWLLIREGAKLGKENGCSMLTTQPADEAKGFYERCGFRCFLEQVKVLVRIEGTNWSGWRRVANVPHWVVGRLPLRIGRVQSSEDMWLMCNRGVRIAGRFEPVHPAARSADSKAFVQLRYIDSNRSAPLVVAWADRQVPLEDLVSAAGTLGQGRGSTSLSCIIPTYEMASLITAGFDVIETGRVEFWSLDPT